jgi:hypothetical protein
MKDADQSRGLGHGHAHFWERALSRSRFIKVVTCATGAALGADVLSVIARAAEPSDATPKPIPGGFSIGDLNFHVSGGPSAEPSVITDFNGIVGIAFVSGHGTGTNTTTGVSTPLLFDSDMRFMTGEYVAADGHHYQGTFGFV